MRRFLILLSFLFLPALAHAWNAAGHRLAAGMAWQQMSPETRREIEKLLVEHPDYQRWVEKAHSNGTGDIFAEASTWPDNIRNDLRFYDENFEAPTPVIPGLPDTAKHKRWHYVDLAVGRKPQKGELDQQIERLSKVLENSRDREQQVYALPWLIHLVADIHQPLHVGHQDDEGGNQFEIDNPLIKGKPFSNLHHYWDELPGPSSLRGKRLGKSIADLLEHYPAPEFGNVSLWREESRRYLEKAYPESNGNQLPTISENFNRQAHEIANQRVVAAGYRLGWLLESIFSRRVSRETP